jgi:hypothetical protein
MKILAALVGIALAALFWAFIARDIRKAPVGAVLSYGPHLWLVAIACAVTFMTLGYFIWRDSGFSSLFPLVFFAGLALVCLMLLLEVTFVGITYDHQYLVTRSPWRPSRRIP